MPGLLWELLLAPLLPDHRRVAGFADQVEARERSFTEHLREVSEVESVIFLSFLVEVPDLFKCSPARRKGRCKLRLYGQSELNRCRVLAAKIANELRSKRPEHFVDKLSLADIHACLERAADVLSTVESSQGLQRHR